MKLIEGGTLADRMHEYREDPRAAVQLMVTVARAVDAAHRSGILHRDLKPGNVLLDEAGEPHITDFGLAKKVEGDSDLTLTGQIMGTPHYMAPEQARGETRQISTAADVYSLGAVLHEMLVGRKLFEADTLVDLLKCVVETPAPPLRQLDASIDRDLETIAAKCL